MITFNDKIELYNDVAHWYIDQANKSELNVFDLFEIILKKYNIEKENMEE